MRKKKRLLCLDNRKELKVFLAVENIFLISCLFVACSHLFHADLQGTERLETLSCGSSDSPRTENNDAMSTHSDTMLSAAREKLSLADYAFLDEDTLSDYSESRYGRQMSAMCETNVSIQHNHLRGKSLSLESLSNSSGYGSSRGHHKHYRRKAEHPMLQNKLSNPLPSPKSERIPNTNLLDVPNRSNIFVKHLLNRRAKSVEVSGSSTPKGEDKVPKRRLLHNLRLEIQKDKMSIMLRAWDKETEI